MLVPPRAPIVGLQRRFSGTGPLCGLVTTVVAFISDFSDIVCIGANINITGTTEGEYEG
jgi:hypothetical protein